MKRVKATLKRAEEATRGPWGLEYRGERPVVLCEGYEDETPGVCGSMSQIWPMVEEDAAFIAEARTEVPWMAKALIEAARLVRKSQRADGGITTEEARAFLRSLR